MLRREIRLTLLLALNRRMRLKDPQRLTPPVLGQFPGNRKDQPGVDRSGFDQSQSERSQLGWKPFNGQGRRFWVLLGAIGLLGLLIAPAAQAQGPSQPRRPQPTNPTRSRSPQPARNAPPGPAQPKPAQPNAARSQQAQAAYARGTTLAAAGKLQQAIEAFSESLRLNPALVEAYNDRATAYAALDNSLAAMADYNRAIELDPQYANAYFNRANLLVQQQAYFRAIEDYDRALAIAADDAEAFHNRAIAQAAVGNLQEAVDNLQQAARLFARRGDREGYERALNTLRLLQPAEALPNANPANANPPNTNPTNP